MSGVQDDTAYIRALISEGEHVRQDFKFEISDSRKIARSLSAFANTEGGRLLIGVKDNGLIAGVRSEEEMYMVEAAAQVYCTPAVEVDMRVYRPEGRSVLVASVGPAVRKPVLVKEEDGRRLAYVRIADENILASPVHIGLWKCEADDGRVHEVPDFAILRQDPVSVTFTEQETELLAVVAAASGGLTLSQICRRVTIPRRRVVHLLSLFVHWGLVGIRHDSRGFFYCALD